MDMRNTLKFAIRVTATIGICEDQKLFGQHDFQTARGERERESRSCAVYNVFAGVFRLARAKHSTTVDRGIR